MTKTLYSMPLQPGDDVLAWLRIELPKWGIADLGGQGTYRWWAASPTVDLDGVSIVSDDPIELVERVRTLERILAIVMERQGNVPVVATIGGMKLDSSVSWSEAAEDAGIHGPPSPKSLEPKPDPALQTLSMAPTEMAKFMGYTGIPCDSCGSMRTVRIGRCLRCEACKHAGECG